MILLRRKSCVVVAGMVVWLLTLCGVAAGSPASDELIQQGVSDLTAQKFTDALKKFQVAAQSGPADAEAFFFQGAAMNRMGRPQEALVQLEKAAGMGFKGPGLAFDTGWALLRLGRWIDSIVQLTPIRH